MSLEHFFAVNPPDEQLREAMLRKQAEQIGPTKKSLAANVADSFAQAGADGLRAIAYRLERPSRGGGATLPAPGENTRSPDDGRNYNAIFLGKTILAIEQTLATEYFDTTEYIDSINAALVGTKTSKVTWKRRDPVERITPVHWDQMIAMAQQDPTLATFLDEGNEAMLPRSLRIFLKSRDRTRVAYFRRVRVLLPKYYALAVAVVDQQPHNYPLGNLLERETYIDNQPNMDEPYGTYVRQEFDVRERPR
jgi:hypothetical protein